MGFLGLCTGYRIGLLGGLIRNRELSLEHLLLSLERLAGTSALKRTGLLWKLGIGWQVHAKHLPSLDRPELLLGIRAQRKQRALGNYQAWLLRR